VDTSFLDRYHDSVFSHPLFRRLNLREKGLLKDFYILQEYLKGERIIFDGDIVESLYMVLDGSVSHLYDGKPGQLFWSGDFWGLETLQSPRNETGLYLAREDCVILRLRAEGFRRFQELCPGSRGAFRPRLDSRGHHLSGFPFSLWKSLGSGKKPCIFEGRSSIKSFSLFMLIPAAGILAGMVLFSLSPWFLSLSIAGIVTAFCEIFLRNMTLYRVSEKTAFMRFFNWRGMKMEQEEVPLDQVKSININVKGLLRHLFNMGDLSIQTAGRGIVFRNIDKPKDLQKALMEIKQRRQFEQQGEQREEFRRMVRDNLKASSPEVYAGSKSSAEKSVFPQKKIFRKSPAVLVFQIFLPLTLLLLTLFLPSLLPYKVVRVAVWLLRLTVLMRILWLSVDWWNDIYKIELPFIWDIERKPFGTREVRTQTDLAGVINVHVSQKGILRLLLNYGDVIIETPGNSGTLEFFSVRKPRSVQREIFQLREYLLLQKEKKQQEQTMKQFGEFAEILRQVQDSSLSGNEYGG